MRDLPGLRHPRQLLLATFVTTSLLGSSFAMPALALPREVAHASAKKHHQPSAAQRRRDELGRRALKKPSLVLDSNFVRRAQAAGSVVPFTVRLRKPYEGGPGDDQLQLNWDTAAVPWPLPGTVPPAAPSTTNLDGAFSYQWDFGADTSGYATLGTVETRIGGGVSATGTGFPLAVADGTCSTLQSLDVTGMSLTSAGLRFGSVNPFSRVASGTINLRTSIRTKAVGCAGSATPPTAVATSATPDPPLPVAFDGTFTVSPAITSDGHIRLGVLTVADTAHTPQRSVFGLIQACTNPAAADGCDRRAFPVRTKILSLSAEVLAGDQMPPPPAAP
jgi:hypothetical protein